MPNLALEKRPLTFLTSSWDYELQKALFISFILFFERVSLVAQAGL